MKQIVLTGNIGSGKSMVAEILRYLGVPVFDADKAGHEAIEGAGVRSAIVEAFGQGVMQDGGSIDRAALGRIVFGDEGKLNRLSSIIHPFVMHAYGEWIAGLPTDTPLAAMESAIILEYGLQEPFDAVVMVTAPEEVRVERIMKRDGLDREHVLARMSQQWPEERKLEKAGHVIVNDGDTMLIPQVIALVKALREGTGS